MARTYPVIRFGEVEFTKEDFLEARLTEEFHPLTITLPINQLEFSVFSDDVNFSVINPAGNFEALATIRPMALYEVVDNQKVYLGQYYLDDWKNVSENIKQFTAYDVLGLLDRLTQRGGVWLSAVTVGELVAGVLDPVGVSYEIDPDVAAIELMGWLPISTCRDALQQIAFAAGAYVLSARRDALVIGKLSQASIDQSGVRTGVARTGQTRVYQVRWRPTQTFVYTSGGAVTRGVFCGVPRSGQSRNWGKRWRQAQWEGVKPVVEVEAGEQGSRKVNLRPQVTGVEVVAHDIVAGTGSMELLNQAMSAGTHEIHFQQPMHDLSVSGATISASGANYAILEVSSPRTVVLTGLVYVSSDTVYGQYLAAVEGRKENIIRIEDATLVNSGNGAGVCEAVFNYYQQRYLQSMRLFAPAAVEVGVTVDAETLYGNRLFGVVERMETDLFSGFRADTDVVGIIK